VTKISAFVLRQWNMGGSCAQRPTGNAKRGRARTDSESFHTLLATVMPTKQGE